MIQTVGTIGLVLLSLFLSYVFQDAFAKIPAFLAALFSGGYILCYLLATGISNYRKTGHLFDPEMQRRLKAKREEKQARRESEFVDQMAEIYFGKNETRRRKGQSELSREQYMEQFQKENRRGNLYRIILILVVLALFGVQWVTWSWWSAFLADFTFVVDLFALLFIWLLFFSPYVYRTRWSVEEKCRQKQMDLVTYAGWLRASVQEVDGE
ncbi:MAG: hypothetical protein LIO45_01270 [Clostridiales bacterium]|nr:hypothetical protein [Clostridiales bacterium]